MDDSKKIRIEGVFHLADCVLGVELELKVGQEKSKTLLDLLKWDDVRRCTTAFDKYPRLATYLHNNGSIMGGNSAQVFDRQRLFVFALTFGFLHEI